MANLVIKNNNTTGTESSINLKATNVDWKISGDKDNLKILKNGTQIAEIAATGFDATLTQVDQAAQAKAVGDKISEKVDKISGKGLSTNDFTTAYKNKLDGIATGANKYTLPAATSSALGGVKIGSNISNSSGTISLSKDNIVAALGYTPPETDTNTHYTTKLFATSSTGTTHAATTNGNTYLRLFDNTTARQSIKIIGSGATTVESDANGVITISSTDNDTTYTLSGLGGVPTSRTINGKALSTNISLTHSDVGAAASSHTHKTEDIVSGVLPIARGGTNGETASAARANLGFTYGPAEPTGTPAGGVGSIYFKTGGDAVVEAGTDGIWTYRKWASGIAECWGNYTCFGVTATSAWGSMYESSRFTLADYPFTFTEIPTQNISVIGTGGSAFFVYVYSSYGPTTTSAGNVNFYRPTSNSTSQNVTLSIYTIGRWK